jgi:hypothetical protein
MTIRLGLANDHDQIQIIWLMEEAASWLRNKGTDQWARPWPSRSARDARICADISEGKTWIAWDGDTPAATITSEETAHQPLLSEWDDGEPAAYVHRLVVARRYGGRSVGSSLLNWAGAGRCRATEQSGSGSTSGRQTKPCTDTTCVRVSHSSANAGMPSILQVPFSRRQRTRSLTSIAICRLRRLP